MKRLYRQSNCRRLVVARIGLGIAFTFGALVGCSGSDDPLDAQESAIVERAIPTATGVGRPSVTKETTPTATREFPDPTEMIEIASATPQVTPTVISTRTPTPDATATSSALGPATPYPAVEVAEFQSHVRALLADVDGLAEIVVALPDGTTLFEANAWEPMESASLYKLPIVVEVFRLRDVGAISFDQQIQLLPDYFSEEDSVYGEEWIGAFVDIGTLIEHTVTLSSNVAPKALLAMAGNEAINDTMLALGLTGTEVRWSPGFVGLPSVATQFDAKRGLASTRVDGRNQRGSVSDVRADLSLNVTTAGDMALLFRKLVNGEVFSPAASREMLDLLARQLINDRMPAYLPEGTRVAHKTGNLDGLVHDVGVIFAPDGPIVVICLIEAVDEGYAAEMIRKIAAEAYAVGS